MPSVSNGGGGGGNSFLPARAKLWIGSLDIPSITVQARYNPEELSIKKSLAWQAPGTLNASDGSARASTGGGGSRPRGRGSVPSAPALSRRSCGACRGAAGWRRRGGRGR